MARKGTSAKGRTLNPLQLRRQRATRSDAVAFSLNHRPDSLGGPQAAVIQDTWANIVNYPAPNYPLGQLYEVLSDRPGLWYVVQSVGKRNTWRYAGGVVHDSRANVAGYGLGANDAGLLAHLTDYAHLVEWDGAAFRILDGQGGYIVDAVAALATGWQLCDGTVTDFLLDNTTNLAVTPFTTPDEKTANPGTYHRSAAAYSGVISAATLPTFNGSAGTTGNDGDAGSHAAAGAGGDPLVALNPHTHAFTPAGTIALPGDPVKNMGVLRY